MPDQDSRRRTRVRVAETIGDTARFTQVAPITQSRSGTADAAFALADILKSSQQFAHNRDERLATQAQVDFETGQVDDSEENLAYTSAVSRLQAQSDWVMDQEEIEDELRSLDRDNMSPAELDAFLTEQYARRWAGLDDESYAEVVIPRMQEFREKLLAEQGDIFRDNIIKDQQARLQVVSEDFYENALQTGLQFNYQDINDTAIALFPAHEANEQTFRILADIAIRNGDPELLRNVPDQWANNAPTFKNIPDFNERVLAAELRAEARREQLINQARKENDDFNKENIRLAEVEMAETILAGGDPGYQLEGYLQLPGVQGGDALTFRKNYSTIRDDLEERAADEQFLARLSSQVLLGQSGHRDILEAYLDGSFGTGRKATSLARSFLKDASTTANRGGGSPLSDPQAAAYRKHIVAQYAGSEELFSATLAEVQRSAVLEYDTRVINGEDPETVWTEVQEKYDPRANRAGEVFNSDALTPSEAAGAFISGSISTSRLRDAGVNSAWIQDNLDALTDEQARKIISALQNN